MFVNITVVILEVNLIQVRSHSIVHLICLSNVIFLVIKVFWIHVENKFIILAVVVIVEHHSSSFKLMFLLFGHLYNMLFLNLRLAFQIKLIWLLNFNTIFKKHTNKKVMIFTKHAKSLKNCSKFQGLRFTDGWNLATCLNQFSWGPIWWGGKPRILKLGWKKGRPGNEKCHPQRKQHYSPRQW